MECGPNVNISQLERIKHGGVFVGSFLGEQSSATFDDLVQTCVQATLNKADEQLAPRSRSSAAAAHFHSSYRSDRILGWLSI